MRRVTSFLHIPGSDPLASNSRVSHKPPYVKRCVVGSLPRLVHREVSPWLVIGGDLDRPVSLRSDSPLPAAEDVRISCHLRAVSRALDNFKALFAVVLKPG